MTATRKSVRCTSSNTCLSSSEMCTISEDSMTKRPNATTPRIISSRYIMDTISRMLFFVSMALSSACVPYWISRTPRIVSTPITCAFSL